MKSQPVEIGRLLQNRWRFCVPIYQRHYVWSRQKQWDPFWTDVRTKAIERLAGRERRFSHFMGAVVLEARGGFTSTKVPSFLVVDGQQRLTTFQLFLAAARNYARMCGLATTAEKISTFMLNDKPHLMADPDLEIFKIWPTEADRPLFLDILTLDRKELRRKYIEHYYAKQERVYDWSTVPKLLGAYGFFFDKIAHAVETDDLEDEFTEAPESSSVAGANAHDDGLDRELKLDAIWEALVEEFQVVEITLEEGDDAQVIFETLNERGEPLLAADLVRNNIFQRADATDDMAEKLFYKYWALFERPFWNAEEKQGRYKKARIDFFLAHFISGQIASEVNLSKLFSEYKSFVKRRKYVDVTQEVQELRAYGEIYLELIERASDSVLADFSKRLLPWDVTTIHPLILRLWANAVLSATDKQSCLEMLMTFVVRRAVCGLTTKNYNRLFLSGIGFLDQRGWAVQNVAAFLLSQTAESSRLPRDEEFQKRWIESPLYTLLQPGKARAVLEQLELASRNKFHETNTVASGLTVEHVLPQSWIAAWPLPDGSRPTDSEIAASALVTDESFGRLGIISRRNRLKESIGNLTLLTQPLNSAISNGPFAAKRVELGKHSLLALNREIVQHEVWDEVTIRARSSKLFELALQLWKLPAIEARQ